MYLHLPVIKSAGAAIGAYLLCLAVHSLFDSFELFFWTWLGLTFSVVGMVYTQGFEYLWHRVFMHMGVRFFERVKKKHLEHHIVFDGDNFQSRRIEDLNHIATQWNLFPVLFFGHYLTFCLFAADYAPMFFSGVVSHFVVYEVCHWCSHVKDNCLDKFLILVPAVGPARAKQVEHHRIHHKEPVENFNFTPPYVGDRVFKTLRATGTESCG